MANMGLARLLVVVARWLGRYYQGRLPTRTMRVAILASVCVVQTMHRTLVILNLGVAVQEGGLGDKQVFEGAPRLDERGDCLAVDGALEVLVEVGEPVRGILFSLGPAS